MLVLLASVVGGCGAGIVASPDDPLSPQTPIDLRINYDPGTYVMVQNMTMNMSMNMGGQSVKTKTTMVMTAELVVGKADNAGSREMTFTFRHMKTETSQGGQTVMTFDSSNKKAQDPMSQMYNAMIGRTITMTVDPRGTSSNVRGFDEMMDAMLKDVPEGPEKANLRKSFGSQLLEGLGQMQTFPDKPVSRGDTWEEAKDVSLPMMGEAQIKQVFTLKDVKGGVATIGISAEIKAQGGEGDDDPPASIREMSMTLDGTMFVEIATGLARSGTMTQQASFVVFANGMEMEMTMDGEHNITITKGTYTAPKAAK